MSDLLILSAVVLLMAQQTGAILRVDGEPAEDSPIAERSADLALNPDAEDVAGTLQLAEPGTPSAQAAAAELPRPSIPDGTDIPLELTETLSSKSHVKGDLFKLKVVKDVIVDGVNVLPVGTTVVGEITRAETKAAFGVSGKLEAKLLYAELPDGPLRLRGTIGARGDGGTFETVVTYAFIGSLAFVVTGKSAEIPAGAQLIGRTGNR